MKLIMSIPLVLMVLFAAGQVLSKIINDNFDSIFDEWRL